MPSLLQQPISVQQPKMLIPNTLFPYLDTVYRSSTGTNPTNDGTETKCYVDLDWRFTTIRVPQGTLRLDQSAIYEAYARFLSAFLGREEIAFYAKGLDEVSSVRIAVIGEAVPESGAKQPVAWQLVDSVATQDASLDFAVHITENPEFSEAVSVFDDIVC
jgi:hypothetical protein